MIVRIPPPLHSYTGGLSSVEGKGDSLRAVLDDLDARFRGLRFRIIDEHDHVRPHIKLFVNARLADSIERPVAGTDEVHIICAVSGG